MPLKSTFLALKKKGTSCPNWGEGGRENSGNARKKTFFLQEVLPYPYTFDIIMLVQGDWFQHYRGCNRSEQDETNGNVGRVNMFLHQDFLFLFSHNTRYICSESGLHLSPRMSWNWGRPPTKGNNTKWYFSYIKHCQRHNGPRVLSPLLKSSPMENIILEMKWYTCVIKKNQAWSLKLE